MSGVTKRFQPRQAALRALGVACVLTACCGALHAAMGDVPVRLDQLTMPAAATYPKVAVSRNVPIVMRDGTRLYADIHQPADLWGRPIKGRFPSVLVQGPYRKALQQSGVTLGQKAGIDGAGALAMSNDFVRHGYVQVVVDVRGTGDSGGPWRVWDQTEQTDYLDVTTWLRTQPFSNGHYGLFGVSYLAIAAMLTAEQQPPGLEAVFAVSAADDIYRDLFRGGDVPVAIIGGLTGAIKLLGLVPPSSLTRAIQLYQDRFNDVAWPTDFLNRTWGTGELAYDSDFFSVRSPGTRVNKIKAPTFLVGGWHDIYQRGVPRLYQSLQLPPGQKQLMMGPWYHLTTGSDLGKPGAPPLLDTLTQLWFDHWLKGIDNGIERFGPVTVNTLGANTWRSMPAVPGSNVSWQRFHLGPGGSLTAQAAIQPGWDEKVADLKNNWCSRSTVQWTAGVLRQASCEADNREVEAKAFNYTTEPLAQDLHISGPLALSLQGSTTGKDANWVVEVTDVSPEGVSSQITGGALLSSRRAVDAARSTYAPDGTLVAPYHPHTPKSQLPVPSGVPVQLDIEIFNTDALIRQGHRLRVTIRSADQPVLGPPKAVAAEREGTVRVHHGASTDSVLMVPVAHD
jgi:putative CocE/NonD family hydrolase